MPNYDSNDESSARNSTERFNEDSLPQQETLSRMSVYSTLKSLDSVVDIQASSSNTRIPKSVHDDSLLSFYETVSKDYHRKVPRLDGKNTSGRPLSAPEISGRIRRRALTLIGGGYNAKAVSNSISTITSTKTVHSNKYFPRGHHATSNLSGRHRKRKRTNLWFRLTVKSEMGFADKCARGKITEHDVQFLIKLNGEWNVYIKNVLMLDSSVDPSMIDSTLLQKQIVTLAAQDLIEWVGALVQIKECLKTLKSKEHLVGVKGILLSHSVFCWEIIPIKYQEELSKPNVELCGISHTISPAITIPKCESAIAVLIPVITNSDFSNESGNEAQFISVLLKES